MRICQGGVVTGAKVVVPPGGVVACTITNTAVSPLLTLVKVVDNGLTGATTPATEWVLSAAGPTPVSGRVGEGGGDGGAGAEWGRTRCRSRVLGGYTPLGMGVHGGGDLDETASVTLVEGESATCTITNTAITPGS